MTEEQIAALGEGYDMILELTEYIRDRFTPEQLRDAREILNDARGVLDLIENELYKTL